MSVYFIQKKYFFLVLVSLIIFMHVMQSFIKIDFNAKSFVNDQSIKDLLAKNDCFVPSSIRKIDWHDYNQIKLERKRTGPGEHGKPVFLGADTNIRILAANIYNFYGLNGLVSEKICLDRSLPDIRHPACMKKKYIESLPSVSIIIPFHNDHINTLLRTVRSVINRSPPELIKEIIIVDDASTIVMLHKQVKDYIKKYEYKVKVLKLSKNNGLIRAKLHGAKEATGNVLVFLDAHCEVNVNWLPPLLEPVALDYRTVMCPIIDRIDYKTFEYRSSEEYRGSFDWGLNFKQNPLLKKDIKQLPKPYANPVMMGGICAISRIFFWELGGYDPGLYIWGGDQYELSFKIWQCGGRMFIAPCSRVGHVFRQTPYLMHYGYGDFVRRNNRRIADVWMDGFALNVYMFDSAYSNIDPGDISEQVALRQRLHCKPFSWFMSEIATVENQTNADIDRFPLAQGHVRPISNQSLCVNADFVLKRLFLSKCRLSKTQQQLFEFTYKNSIKSQGKNVCWDLPVYSPNCSVQLNKCHDLGRHQLWRYDLKTLQIMQTNSKCLDWNLSSFELYINRCNKYSNTQEWNVDYTFLF